MLALIKKLQQRYPAFALIMAMALFQATGCVPPVEPDLTYSHDATVTHPEPISLVISPGPGVSAIYFTTDGEVPVPAECDTYDGSPILVGATTTFTIAYDKEGEILTEEITFAIESSDVPANIDTLNAWLAYETAVREALACANNGCDEPGAAINWSIEDGMGGTATWVVQVVSLKGCSTFTYNNFTHNGVTVNGSIANTSDGCFGLDKNGKTTGTVTLTGAATGTVVDNLVITGGNKAGGNYQVSCSYEGCAEEAVQYNAPNWIPVLDTPGAVQGTCAKPWLMIRSKDKGLCATALADGDLQVSDCDANSEAQQFEVFGVGSGAFQFKTNDESFGFANGACITDASNDFRIAECDDTDAKQQFTLSGTGEDIKISPASRDVCWFSGTTGGNDIWGTTYNCGVLNGLKWGFFLEGDFGSTITPDTIAQ